nr:FCD domain-containing protein [Streptomyces sp. SM12]
MCTRSVPGPRAGRPAPGLGQLRRRTAPSRHERARSLHRRAYRRRRPATGRGTLGPDPSRSSCPVSYTLTERFAQAVVSALRNAPLAKTIADQRGQTARLRTIAQAAPERLDVSLGEHLAITRAIVDGRHEAAALEVTGHLQQMLRTVIDGLTRGSLPSDVDVQR